MTALEADLCRRLAVALARDLPAWAGAALEPLRDTGLGHWHVRLVGRGVLARIPKQSQMALGAVASLAYEATCFSRASASGHTPSLEGVLSVCSELPRGALLVEDIVGRAATLPQDLGPIARALAAMHALPLPRASHRAPLDDRPDPLAALRDEIVKQAQHLEAAGVETHARRQIEAGIAALRRLCSQPVRPAKALISFDAHPGNFVVQADGEAVLVDLEKCRYGYPPLDLGHATLYTSTTWDLDHSAALTETEVAAAYAHWASALGERSTEWLAWHLPLRRAMWLWSVTWCAKWRVVSRMPPASVALGEDWSAAASAASLVEHVRERVDHYLSRACVARVVSEFDSLVDLLPAVTFALEAGR